MGEQERNDSKDQAKYFKFLFAVITIDSNNQIIRNKSTVIKEITSFFHLQLFKTFRDYVTVVRNAFLNPLRMSKRHPTHPLAKGNAGNPMHVSPKDGKEINFDRSHS